MLKPYLLLGEIVRPQGIRGEVKVRHYTDDPERFAELDTVYREDNGAYLPLTVTGSRAQGDDVFLTLEGVADRDAAEALRGTRLYIDRDHARELGEDEVFIADLLGARVVDTAGREVGTIRDVLHAGGADVFALDTPYGGMMMPALKAVIRQMDVAGGRVVLDREKLREVAVYENRDPDDFPGDV